MPPLTRVELDVYADVPYRNDKLRGAAPKSESSERKMEAVWAFKNGRAMDEEYGGRPFKDLVDRLVLRCEESPLAAAAADTTWVPVPRSGKSKKSKDPRGDPYPCRTLAEALAQKLGGRADELISRRYPFNEKYNIQAGISSLKCEKPPPSSSRIVLVDDVFTTGCTLISCAAALRESGYEGGFYAFCAGYAIHGREAEKANPSYLAWRLHWRPGWERPSREALGPWREDAR